MSSFLIDASVAAKWALPGPDETLVPEAQLLLEQYERGKISFAVPDLFWIELGNMLWKAARRRRISEQDAKAALAYIRSRELHTFGTLPVLNAAMEIALHHDRSVYDSVYLALAIELNVSLVTADEKLFNAMVRHAPVKWLGAL